MGKVEPTNEGSQSGILSKVVESLGENNGVGKGHGTVQHSKGGGVQRARGQEASNQVDVARRVAIGGDIQRQVGDDQV